MILPTNWSSITLRQYQELEELNDLSGIELILERLAVLLDTDIYDSQIFDLDMDDILTISNKISWLDSEPNFIGTDIDFHLKPKDLNTLFLGEFIDIEHYINEPIKNLHIVSAIYFKKIKLDEWENTIEEPYIYDIQKRSELFLDLPITYILKYYKSYLMWRDNFLKTYENLFIENQNEEVDLQGYDLIEYQKEVLEEKVKSKWSWESILLGLSNGDVTKFDKLFKTPLILVFNTLSAKKVLGV